MHFVNCTEKNTNGQKRDVTTGMMRHWVVTSHHNLCVAINWFGLSCAAVFIEIIV
jgi:hypothetical protein